MPQSYLPQAVSRWAPFKRLAFFWVWIGVVLSSVGALAQTVGAKWLFVHDPNAATSVTLIQTPSTLPMMLLALPPSVLADELEARRIIEPHILKRFELITRVRGLGAWLDLGEDPANRAPK
jgi:hypothetical protein